jgi:hypothetical protein
MRANWQGTLPDGARWGGMLVTYITPSVVDGVFQAFHDHDLGTIEPKA